MVLREICRRFRPCSTRLSQTAGRCCLSLERHLLTFGLIENIPLVHEHEKLLLQEMVMSQNYDYLDEFAAEMAEQRYAMIVTDPLARYWKDPENSSGDRE